MDEQLQGAIAKADAYIVSSQLSDGSWEFPVFDDPRTTAMVLCALRQMDRSDSEMAGPLAAYLCAQQDHAGSWSCFPGSGSDVELTAMCTIALEGYNQADAIASHRRASKWLMNAQVPEMDGFWLGFLACNGDLDWKCVPYVSPRVVTLPDWFHPNLNDLSVVRIAIVAMSVIQTKRLEEQNELAPARALDDWKSAWVEAAMQVAGRPVNRFLRWCSASKFSAANTGGVKAALAWLSHYEEKDGTYFSSVHVTLAVLLALYSVDAKANEKAIDRGLDALRRWQHPAEQGARQSFTDSVIWDTVLCSLSLQSSNHRDAKTCVSAASEFLLSKQIPSTGQAPATHLGWTFQRIGDRFPDVDDTVLTLSSLIELDDVRRTDSDRLLQATEWLISMQSRGGGWASWSKNEKGWVKLLQGGKWFLHDTPCPVLTTRASMLLSNIGSGSYSGLTDIAPKARQAAQRGFRFVDRQQQDGKWVCRWFTHYIYGTAYGIEALHFRGHAIGQPAQWAADWLQSIANPDGGFGESASSLNAQHYVPAESTAFHTAVALIALVRAGRAESPVSAAAARWLLKNQKNDGAWDNADFFAAGVPGVWYTNFSVTPTYYARKALALFADKTCP